MTTNNSNYHLMVYFIYSHNALILHAQSMHLLYNHLYLDTHITFCILQTRKLKFTEIKKLTQSHRVYLHLVFAIIKQHVL